MDKGYFVHKSSYLDENVVVGKGYENMALFTYTEGDLG